MITRVRVPEKKVSVWKERTFNIIFRRQSKAGKAFDMYLLWAILCSVIVTTLESVVFLEARFRWYLVSLEWIFTFLFTAEYILRVLCIKKSTRYIFSFFGLVDLIAILPTYFSLFLTGSQSLQVVRSLRLLRVFRVLRLRHYVREAVILEAALKASQRKIIVFLGFLFTIVLIIGSCMYLIEGDVYGFSSIPESTYWAIVTMTTVGYGDIVPQTVLGKTLAALLMIIGYAIIAIPTGIVSLELATKKSPQPSSELFCTSCLCEVHDSDAKFCKQCGSLLN